MKKQDFLRKAQNCYLKYSKHYMRGHDFRATYWLRKSKQYFDMGEIAATLTKRQLGMNGTVKLNTIKL